VPFMSTNNGALGLAFQEWRHFKEAFAPELTARAIQENPIPVNRCIDPFGGSGTTAISCQFLGVEPITIEVNPYLADLIEAKLTTYDPDAIARDLGIVLRSAMKTRVDAVLMLPPDAPQTLIEPGLNGRWIFDYAVAQRLGGLIGAIQSLENEKHRRLFHVLLGGILLEVSNVIVNGKGRRYRKSWQKRPRDANKVERLFSGAVRNTISDIYRFRNRAQLSYTLIRGDARCHIEDLPKCELSVFSPPYPNSFDYTDVYNLELWVLGYLDTRTANSNLRKSTLCSHVQIDRIYPPKLAGSPTLDKVIDKLSQVTTKLWHKRIPDMVGGYFADLFKVLSNLQSLLHHKGRVWLVVGDSRYAGVTIPTAAIIDELAPTYSFRTLFVEPFRSMRSSAQQGGRQELSETLVVLNSTMNL